MKTKDSASAPSVPSSSAPRETRGLGRNDADTREFASTKGRIVVRGKLVTRRKAKRADPILDYKPNIPIVRLHFKTILGFLLKRFKPQIHNPFESTGSST